MDPDGISVLVGDGAARTPLFDYSSVFTGAANGNSPAWNHLGWSAPSFGATSGPGGLLAVNQVATSLVVNPGAAVSFTGEALATTLAVALSGYANNKGAEVTDLYSSFVSANTGGPVDALGNGLLGALNSAGSTEGSTWWWGAPYAAAYATYPNGTRVASTTPYTAATAAASPAAAWLLANATPTGVPNPWAGLAGAAAAGGALFAGGDPFGAGAGGAGRAPPATAFS